MFGRYIPSPPLSHFVRCFWHADGMPRSHSRERLMPTGEASIVFNLRDEHTLVYDPDYPDRYVSCGHSVISGARTKSCLIDISVEDRMLGIQFLPGGSFPFFAVPSSEFENHSVSLEDLWPHAHRIRERLLGVRSVDEMFAMVERELLASLVRPLELHPAVQYACKRICSAPHATTIASLVKDIGISQRRLSQLFGEQIGITPKAFCRVRRFQSVLSRIHPIVSGSSGIDWAGFALDCGYYDQAHFIHDFRAFSGASPSSYLASRTEHRNHVGSG